MMPLTVAETGLVQGMVRVVAFRFGGAWPASWIARVWCVDALPQLQFDVLGGERHLFDIMFDQVPLSFGC